ncbi:MAG: transketolase [Candidatus Latescibacterota bacterium]|nr:MAG: transketolase [Candidatus Latescibacterota bacterium]
MSTTQRAIDELCINSVRVLAMDAVEKAKSGHPGTAMALAPLAYLLWTRHLRHNPADPDWLGRDRFVLSCGHASMLLYALLHLSGYELGLDDLKDFRQWESKTPGHPEYRHTPGVETTTGPLGQGLGNAVGMALAEAHLSATFRRDGHKVVEHRTWFVASDGDLMEGVSHEAASLAGHLRLGRLIGFYDDNHITIDGPTELAYSDDVARRFEAYGWHVQRVEDGNDLEALDHATRAALDETLRPSLIVVRTHIGWGSPNKQDTSDAHGAPLGETEVRLTKENLGWPTQEPFFVPEAARAAWLECRSRGAQLQAEWQSRYTRFATAHSQPARELERRLRGDLPDGWDSALPHFAPGDPAIATRAASGQVLNALADRLPELIGGSADLAPSNNTLLRGWGDLAHDDYAQRNLRFGVREHGMGAILNGLALHGGVVPYGGTFLVFSDYMRPAVRLAALMGLRVIYVYTHDSIGLGEDGPTHQPVETLAALRVIPNLVVLRPADAAETVEAWKVALQRRDGPSALALTRQKLPLLERTAGVDVARGGYVLLDPAKDPDLLLLGSGSEVTLAVEAAQRLSSAGVAARVVSMPSLELFASQPPEYRERVLPPATPRVAIEAAHPMPWYRWVGERGDVIGIERFGASAPYKRLYEGYGLTADAIVQRATRVLEESS